MSKFTEKIESELMELANPEKVKVSQWFFKTGKGEYGEGDVFWGITMPEIRIVAKKYSQSARLEDVEELLHNPVHEVRMLALLLLVYQFPKAKTDKQEEIYNFYLANAKYINNWDLVDVTCRGIVGAYLLKRDRAALYKLVKSESLWEKRIAIVSTWEFIRHHDFSDTLKMSEMLLQDKHDLIHKAVGWMLREVYKRDTKPVVAFLEKYKASMPRTALRYAIERMSKDQQQYFLGK